MSGWVLTVEFKSSAGPSAASCHKSCPRTSAASANVSRTGLLSAKLCSMPTACEPCPGKTNASFIAATSPRGPVSYTHLRAHETPEHLVCRLLLEKKTDSY